MRSKRLFQTGIVASGLLTVAAFVGSAIPASAQTFITLETVNAGGASNSEWVCSTGLHELGFAAGDIVNADNGCNGRLWLHRDADGGGATFCINPNTDEEIPPGDQSAQSITASTNTAKC